MASEPTADALRAMAEHRGLTLKRSRKRTPGVGDFGKFGLTDSQGNPLLGIGDNGLTASAEEIEEYLRGGAARSWKLSAESTPARAHSKRAKSPQPADEEEEETPVERRRKSVQQNKAPPAPPRLERHPLPPRAKPVLRIVKPEAPPKPELRIRAATRTDVNAIGRLLAQLADPPKATAVTEHFNALRKTRASILIAERGKIAGCCAWAIVPTLQHGLVGRITLLLVDENYRRRGVATAMLESVQSRLAEAGCVLIEAMSDIMIANSHNFFRSLDFEQKSYRFVRAIDKPTRQ